MIDTILILGIGNAQLDLFEFCKGAGMKVFSCSNADEGPGLRLSDHFERIDITDIDGVTAYAQRVRAPLVYSVGSDVAMPTVSAASERLGLPHFVDAGTARICNDKGALRARLGPGFVGNLSHQVLSGPDEPVATPFPLVLKPVDSQGQRGVRLVRSISELREHFGAAKAFSRSGRVIVEEYVDGPEISVNTYSVEGRVVFLALSDRIVWPDYPGGIIREHRVPCCAARGAAREETIALVHRTLAALGVENGPAYFQLKLKGDEPRLIEVTPRLDGCHMWRLLFHFTGVDLLALSLGHLRGTAPRMPPVGETPGRGAFRLEFICEEPHCAFARDRHPVERPLFLLWYYEDGQIVKPLNGLFEKCGYQICETPLPPQ